MCKTAFITGAAKRLGKEMAIHLAKKGWNIAIHYNSSAVAASQLQSMLVKLNPSGIFKTFRANLSVLEEVEKLIPTIFSEMGAIDLLINNASVFEQSYIKETNAELLNRQMLVNFHAPFILIRDFTRMASKGSVINMVDTRITANRSNYAAYALSKKALWELTKMAALEFAPAIRVNAIAPGVTLAPEEKDNNYLEELAKKIPMKKPGGVEPILKNLDYILENDYLTGQLLFADGGENLGSNQ